MRMIQDKLNTPTNSMEALDRIPPKPNDEKPVERIEVEEKPVAVVNKATPYRPPSINLSTWSERPKTQVSLQEDTDYKTNNSKVTVNATPRISQNSYVKHYDNSNVRSQADSNVSIKVNGSEPIVSQKSGNVIIKIGADVQANEPFFRRPLGTINANEAKSRPHSIAVDATFDMSRVPIVRSVELKKPFKESHVNNKSVTQIYNSNSEGDHKETDSYYKQPQKSFSEFRDVPDKFSEHRRSSETLNGVNGMNGFRANGKHSSFQSNDEMKPVVRVNNFSINAAPTVRGFRTTDSNGNISVHRKTWNTSSNVVLPQKIYIDKKEEENIVTNKNVPFSQSVLKRTESNKNSTNNNNNSTTFPNVVLRNTTQNSVINNNYRNSIGSFPPMEKQSPQPPQMPKIMSFAKKSQKESEPKVDQRDQLLSAIRNFGGKKGLKAVKA